ncbi:hypothetical protein U6G28_09480 [Actinomycetaceae bacterium MB13-C1-2]|nr:hypothetical protein U6G28_09480 [Actinomycetaceae bacterium MB13-C1-2]
MFEFSGVPVGDYSAGTYFVVSGSPGFPVFADGWFGFGEFLVNNSWGASADGAVGAHGVVDGLELLEKFIEFLDGFSWWAGFGGTGQMWCLN